MGSATSTTSARCSTRSRVVMCIPTRCRSRPCRDRRRPALVRTRRRDRLPAGDRAGVRRLQAREHRHREPAAGGRPDLGGAARVRVLDCAGDTSGACVMPEFPPGFVWSDEEQRPVFRGQPQAVMPDAAARERALKLLSEVSGHLEDYDVDYENAAKLGEVRRYILASEARVRDALADALAACEERERQLRE